MHYARNSDDKERNVLPMWKKFLGLFRSRTTDHANEAPVRGSQAAPLQRRATNSYGWQVTKDEQKWFDSLPYSHRGYYGKHCTGCGLTWTCSFDEYTWISDHYRHHKAIDTIATVQAELAKRLVAKV